MRWGKKSDTAKSPFDSSTAFATVRERGIYVKIYIFKFVHCGTSMVIFGGQI